MKLPAQKTVKSNTLNTSLINWTNTKNNQLPLEPPISSYFDFQRPYSQKSCCKREITWKKPYYKHLPLKLNAWNKFEHQIQIFKHFSILQHTKDVTFAIGHTVTTSPYYKYQFNTCLNLRPRYKTPILLHKNLQWFWLVLLKCLSHRETGWGRRHQQQQNPAKINCLKLRLPNSSSSTSSWIPVVKPDEGLDDRHQILNCSLSQLGLHKGLLDNHH